MVHWLRQLGFAGCAVLGLAPSVGGATTLTLVNDTFVVDTVQRLPFSDIDATDSAIEVVPGGVMYATDPYYDVDIVLRGTSRLVVDSDGFHDMAVQAFDDARVELRDGSFFSGFLDGVLKMRDRSAFEMSGGSIGQDLTFDQMSSGRFSGGTVYDTIASNDASSLVFTGGRFGLGGSGLFLAQGAGVRITGGDFQMSFFEFAAVDQFVSGGQFYLGADWLVNAPLTLVGSGFVITPSANGPRLTGTLAGGEALDVFVNASGVGYLVFVPEPAASLLVAFGLVAVASMRSRA